jgi:5'-phosphate synthase pdxT subunit
MKKVGVLALQGAVLEHIAMLDRIGAKGVPIKDAPALDGLDGLIIPGGESTAISRLIRRNNMTDAIRAFAVARPVLGTCAGLVLCGTAVSGSGGALPGREEAEGRPAGQDRLEPLRLMDITVSRNGFGRQVNSFETALSVRGIGGEVPAVFIRAPYIERAGDGVTVLAEIDGKIVMAESDAVLVTAFHPELADDTRIARYFYAKMK